MSPSESVLLEIQTLRQADAIVPDGEGQDAIGRAEADIDLTGPAIGKGMFQSIGNELIDDQAARRSPIHIQYCISYIHLERNA